MVVPRGNGERAARIHQVVEECINRRVVGEDVSDDSVIAAHRDLMPELAEALRRLAIVEQAERQFRDASSAAGGLHDASYPPFGSFPGYDVVDEIWRGGQGVVYEAVQHLTRRRVAIKVLPRDPQPASDRALRFEREVQILGQLNHPNILTIHDTGSTDDFYYYVTEYVSGCNLDEYLSTHRLSVREILELFATICDAVSAAHLLGIIHRDLKPSNVLVDRDGNPQVLDFGLAKLTTDNFIERTMTTTGEFVGSLPWASPEQIAGSPHEIDVRTDVYSLGVMLYHALVGQAPYSTVGNVRDVIDNILTAEPAHPGGVRREINYEVETIVLTCLAKTRDRRYQTAGELGRDIRRYLAGEPIAARQDSVAYVITKHLLRHKLPLAAAATCVVAIMIGFFTSLMYWREAVHERDAAEVAQIEAERQAAIAKAVNDFLNTDLLPAADPTHTQDADITVREVLDAAAARIEDRFDDEPLVEAAVRVTLGTAYRGLGDYSLAELHFAHALDLRRQELGETAPETLEARQRFAESAADQDRADEAEELLLACWEDQKAVLGELHPQTIRSLRALGVLYRVAGRYDEAEEFGVKALELWTSVYGDSHPQTATAMLDLANLYSTTGRITKAEPLYRQALEIWSDAGVPAVQSAQEGLTDIYMSRGRFREAEPLLRELVETGKRVYGDDHPLTLSKIAKLAELYRLQRRLDEAEPLFLRAIEGERRVIGAEHRSTLISMNSLALVYRDQRRHEEAEALFDETLEISRRVLGPDHPITMACLTNLAVLYRRMERYDEAEEMYLEALAAKRRVLGENHPHTAANMSSLGKLYRIQRRFEEAVPLLLQATDTYRATLGDAHRHTYVPMFNLALVYHEQGRMGEAETLMRDVLEARRGILGAADLDTLDAELGLARTLLALGEIADAENLASDSLAALRSKSKPPPDMLALSLDLLADVELARDAPDAAEPLLCECLEVRQASLAEGHLNVVMTENKLGACMALQGRYAEAEPMLLESYGRIASPHVDPKAERRTACRRIIDLYDAWGRPEEAAPWRGKLAALDESPP